MKWWESILTLKRKFNWKKIQFGVVMMKVSVKLIVKGYQWWEEKWQISSNLILHEINFLGKIRNFKDQKNHFSSTADNAFPLLSKVITLSLACKNISLIHSHKILEKWKFPFKFCHRQHSVCECEWCDNKKREIYQIMVEGKKFNKERYRCSCFIHELFMLKSTHPLFCTLCRVSSHTVRLGFGNKEKWIWIHEGEKFSCFCHCCSNEAIKREKSSVKARLGRNIKFFFRCVWSMFMLLLCYAV